MATPKIVNLDVGLIDPPETPDRIEIDPGEIEELADSILEVGLLQPILVRPCGARYEVVAGDRRFKAHQLKGLNRIAAISREMTDDEVAIIRATENLKRENLSALEEARIYSRLNEKFGMSWEAIGKRIGKSPGLVKRRTDILRMPEGLQKALHKKLVSVGVAEELWRIHDVTALEYYLSFAIDNGVTVLVARQWAQDFEREQRAPANENVGGGGFRHPSEQVPVYVACDLCREAMVIGQETILRVCPGCSESISHAIKHPQG